MGVDPKTEGLSVKCVKCYDKPDPIVTINDNVIRFYSMDLILKAGSLYTLTLNDS